MEQQTKPGETPVKRNRIAGIALAAYVAIKAIGILIKITFKKQNK